MKYIIITILVLLFSIASNAKPQCQSFSNHDNNVTIVFTDDKAGRNYSVTDVRLIPSCIGLWRGKEYKATSVDVSINKGVASVILTFDHHTQFSNPKVELKINGKKTTFKVCH